jgi:predicted enzyme related to lactoylglutathione lyase
MPAPLVFFDIASSTLDGQGEFYNAVFDWDVAPDGRFTVPVVSPLPGTFRAEPSLPAPAAERVLYIGVPDITACLDTVVAHGGAVVFPRFEVPGVVIIAMFTDPGGNRMGLVEMADGVPKVPPAR